MPWTAWICLTVLITYCLAQDTLQYNQNVFHRNPTLSSNMMQIPPDLGSDISNAITLQLLMNQPQFSSNYRQTTQFQPINRQNAGILNAQPQAFGQFQQNAMFQPINRQNAIFQSINRQNAIFQPINRQNAIFQPINRQSQFQWNGGNSQQGWGLGGGYGTKDEEEESGITWKDYFENSVDWLACETWANGFAFLKSMVTDDVFREWAISQICQDVMFEYGIPPLAKMLGYNYEGWKF